MILGFDFLGFQAIKHFPTKNRIFLHVMQSTITKNSFLLVFYSYKPWPTDSFSRYKTRVIPNNVCIVISTQFNLNCIFRIDLIHLQQKSLQEYVKTITCTRILNSVRKLRVSNKQLRIKAVISKALFCSFLTNQLNNCNSLLALRPLFRTHSRRFM